MKSARELAEEACDRWVDERREERVTRITRLFKEHARDQRLLCAEAVSEYQDSALGFAHTAAMNAPTPGE